MPALRPAVACSKTGLDKRLRHVFVRCELEGATVPAVAKELGIPVNTGYTRLHLARERIPGLVLRLLKRNKMTKDDV
jgi:DNA-directed RNA polymerase specialized sigma24 family protein